jgi:hypothetical protein
VDRRADGADAPAREEPKVETERGYDTAYVVELR